MPRHRYHCEYLEYHQDAAFYQFENFSVENLKKKSKIMSVNIGVTEKKFCEKKLKNS